MGRYPKGGAPTRLAPTPVEFTSGPLWEPDDVRRDGGRFPKLRRRFAMVAELHEVMPHWPQTTPASTIAFALARSDSSVPTARSSG